MLHPGTVEWALVQSWVRACPGTLSHFPAGPLFSWALLSLATLSSYPWAPSAPSTLASGDLNINEPTLGGGHSLVLHGCILL